MVLFVITVCGKLHELPSSVKVHRTFVDLRSLCSCEAPMRNDAAMIGQNKHFPLNLSSGIAYL